MSVRTRYSRFFLFFPRSESARALSGISTIFLCLALLGALVSCRQVFTTSLGSWAARDPKSLIPTVSSANVADLVSLSENNPALALEVLKGIKNAMASAKGAEKASLQNAAVTAAANASGVGSAILSNAGNINDTLSSGGDVVGVVSTAIAGLGSLSDTSALLKDTLPSPTTDKAGYDEYVKSASAESLANAAVVLLAAQAQKSGGVETYINSTFDPAVPTNAEETLAVALAASAADKYATEGGTGPLADILGSLNLTTP